MTGLREIPAVTVPAQRRAPDAAPSIPDAVRAALRDVGDLSERRRFPREVLHTLGQRGVLRRRWAGPHPGDVLLGTALAGEVARQAPGGVAVGVSLHTESVLAMLHRFAGDSAHLAALREQALDGTAIGCVAASEPTGGSDLSAVQCLASPTAGGWRIDGRKKYVSLGAVADFAVVLCRVADRSGEPTRRLATMVVPLSGARIEREHDKLGTHALDTVAVDFSGAVVPADAMLGRSGLGLATISYGLSFERLAVAAQVIGCATLALELAVEHAGRRTQFGKLLRDHQYLEFGLAEAWAELDVAGGAVRDVARELTQRPLDRRLAARVAALKLHVARLGEGLVSRCMQVFGGAGYLTAETPIGQYWQDVRLARIGGGTDEMMLSLIAGELRGDPEAYADLVRISQ